MYDIALTVSSCLRAGTRVDVAWLVQSAELGTGDPGEAVALTPGGGRAGALLSGAADGRIADVVQSLADRGRVVDVEVSDVDALIAGLDHGGSAGVAVIPADLLPAQLWPHLEARDPICLVARLDGEEIASVELFSLDTVAAAGDDVAALFAAGVSAATRTADVLVTVLWPVPGLVVFGSGAIADALAAAGGLLGWRVQRASDVPTAKGLVARSSHLDSVVVIAHDVEVSGAVLEASLASPIGYVGALGSRRTQQARADWLAYRGITDLTRIHGPAGLDIGARTPPEIAVAILAEALAAHAGERVERPSATAGTR